ncbi:MAG: precorrin-6y C5,15-methyltransferase (decarboxylating) subunit CbiE [Thalassobaculum sp.]|uniref:precorrin-6y C5,15-methyltransferase (decarboxylating) subunit CbiE n=1 Tax=Thalassobaculum sp. TaxID=2022740 RepID=UPI0032EAB285
MNTQTSPWLSVIGVGEDGFVVLSPSARALLDQAEVLVGGDRHLAMLPPGDTRRRIPWPTPLRALVETIENLKPSRVCVLATGDPFCFGIGTTLARRLSFEEMVVVPAASARTLVCARLGWPEHTTRLLTLHGRPLALLEPHLQPGARLILLSENAATPATVAARLAERGFGASAITVLEHMAGSDERRIDGIAGSWAHPAGADLNTVAVTVRAGADARPLATIPGLPDDAFRHDGQMTKREVRAITLAALAPHPGELLWDVGAGCGSIAIEWMRADPLNRAIAIEPKPQRRALIAANAERLGTPTLAIVDGTAPDALAGLEAPDAVFVGGGASTPGVIEACWTALRPGGRLVANTVTLESEAVLLAKHAELGGELVRISVERAEPVGPYHGWRPLMPVTQWRLAKPYGDG